MIQNDTIAAIATPNAVGGISMIRISGPDAVLIAGRVFRTASKNRLKAIRVIRGHMEPYLMLKVKSTTLSLLFIEHLKVIPEKIRLRFPAMAELL